MQVCGKDFQVGEVILGLAHAENELLKAFDHLRTASSRPPAALTRGLASPCMDHSTVRLKDGWRQMEHKDPL